MYSLIKNEIIKMLGKKRLYMILGILTVMVTIFAWGQYYSLNKTKDNLSKRAGTSAAKDWKKVAQQQIIDIEKGLESPYIDDDQRSTLKMQAEQLRYYVNNNINPVDITSASFTTKFIELSISLFLPLLIIILAADLVSSEFTGGTIKLLLVRSVPRWKILLSKYISLLILGTVVIFSVLVVSFIVAGLFFGFGGWFAPVATGFKVVSGKLVTSNVVNIPQWQYTIMAYGLAYYVVIAVGTVSFMISVLIRSSAASIGVILATLIGGSFLSYFLENIKLSRYLFMVNLNLTDYISGALKPINGMNMVFSITVLAVWIAGAIVVSFIYFARQDILV